MATDPWSASAASPDRVVISVDAMGGDRGPAAVVAGLADSIAQYADLDIILEPAPAGRAVTLTAQTEIGRRCLDSMQP